MNVLGTCMFKVVSDALESNYVQIYINTYCNYIVFTEITVIVIFTDVESNCYIYWCREYQSRKKEKKKCIACEVLGYDICIKYESQLTDVILCLFIVVLSQLCWDICFQFHRFVCLLAFQESQLREKSKLTPHFSRSAKFGICM